MGQTFVSYTVTDNRITGFRKVSVEAPFKARSTPPKRYSYPTFSDPKGKRRLVRIVSGPFEGVYVSPDDPGVRYSPGG